MWQVVLSVWRSGFRSRGFQAILFLGFFLVFVAFLASHFSPRQPKVVALDVGLSGLRVSLVLLTLAWVQEYLGKELERRTAYLSLSYPISRTYFLIGRYFGIASLLAVAGLCLGMLLWLVVLLAGGGYEQEFRVALGVPYWLSVLGVLVDALVVLAFAFCVATVSTVSVMPLAVGAAFAIAGKGIGPVTSYLAQGADGQDELVAQFGPIIEVVRWIVPDLSRLDWREWPMYNLPPHWDLVGLALVMAVGYASLMLALAAVAFSRREFS